MDAIAMWCGYAVMVSVSAVAVFIAVYFLASQANEAWQEVARVARQSYWWMRWMRFERIAKARNEATK